jgi:hypothetical protein
MTFLNPSTSEKPINPTTKFLEWKSSKKCFQYYNKEKKENIEVKLPISFIPIKNVSSVTGYSDQLNSGIWSNEVEQTGKESLTIFAAKYSKAEDKKKSCVIAQGFYKDIKGDINSQGGKFTAVLYSILNKELIKFEFSGCSLSAWIEQGQALSQSPNLLSVETFEEKKKGSNKYFVPVFTSGKKLDEKQYAEAVIAGDSVGSYFKDMKKYQAQYTEAQEETSPEQELATEVFSEDAEDEAKGNLPF